MEGGGRGGENKKKKAITSEEKTYNKKIRIKESNEIKEQNGNQ